MFAVIIAADLKGTVNIKQSPVSQQIPQIPTAGVEHVGIKHSFLWLDCCLQIQRNKWVNTMHEVRRSVG